MQVGAVGSAWCVGRPAPKHSRARRQPRRVERSAVVRGQLHKRPTPVHPLPDPVGQGMDERPHIADVRTLPECVLVSGHEPRGARTDCVSAVGISPPHGRAGGGHRDYGGERLVWRLRTCHRGPERFNRGCGRWFGGLDQCLNFNRIRTSLRRELGQQERVHQTRVTCCAFERHCGPGTHALVALRAVVSIGRRSCGPGIARLSRGRPPFNAGHQRCWATVSPVRGLSHDRRSP